MELREKTDQELYALQDAVRAELTRRKALADVLQTEPGLADTYLTSIGREPGAEWVQPLGYFDAYPLGWEVTHDNKVWMATRDGASGEPGESPDWQQVPEEDEILPWVQPHAGMEYPPGSLVTHNGHVWRNDLDRPNGWQPGAPHSGWTDLGPTN